MLKLKFLNFLLQKPEKICSILKLKNLKDLTGEEDNRK